MEKNQNNAYDVGDVVYFINPKDESVIPALVTEVIIRHRLNADTMSSYVANVSTRGGTKEIELHPASVQLFAGLEDVRAFMIEKTTQKIDQIIATAEAASKALGATEVDTDITEPTAGDANSGDFVVLPDGTKARLRV